MIRHSMMRAAAKRRAMAGGDPYWANVVLLCNFTSGLNDAKGKAATAFGGVAASGGAVTFDGVDDRFSFADHADFAFGSSDFTIEFFASIGSGVKAADAYHPMLQQNSGSTTNNSLYCYFESRTEGSNRAWSCKWFNASSAVLVGLEEVENAVNDYTEGQEYHIAIERVGSGFTLYRDGVSKATATYAGALPDATGAFQVGSDQPGGGFYKGTLNGLRITKGVARYQGAFTPPANLFPEG